MQKKIRTFYLILSSLVIAILQLPFAFARPFTGNKSFLKPVNDSTNKTEPAGTPLISKKSVYDSLHLDLKGLSREAFEYATIGFNKLKNAGNISNKSIITVIDFSLPSNKKRMFVIDMDHYKVLYNTLVSHGMNTGTQMATSFSNANESHKSSPGFYVTSQTYTGKHGLSLRLQGMERGINDKAMERGIVVHGAPYVNESIAAQRGWIGRSHGCPAVPDQLSTPIINTIKGGSCLFIYHPSYVDNSVVLN
jgi:hypothetical protein